jgi:hypothetical protein
MSKNKKTGLIIAGIALAVISVLCALTAIGLVGWINNEGSQIQFIKNDNVKATTYETLTFDSADLTELDFNLDFSDIEITESEDDQITLDLIKIGWASSEEEAEKAADALTLESEKHGSTLAFSMQGREPEINVLSVRNNPDTIDINLSVPKGLQISIQVSAGQITASEYQGTLFIENDFGNTEISDFSGSLDLNSSNGKTTLNTISLTEPFSLNKDFGDIFINQLEAPEIHIKNQNGKISMQDITSSGECLINSDFTNIEIDTIKCSVLTIESQNGSIELNHGIVDGLLYIQTDFGDLSIKDITAESYSFTSLNGKIFANTLKGAVTIDSDFGDIELYGKEEIILNVESQNGNIYFQGTLAPEAEHTIESNFGKIEVHIPQESTFDIYMATDFGEIKTDFPITLTGKLDASQMEGQINSGGSLLTLESQNGDIILNYLEN